MPNYDTIACAMNVNVRHSLSQRPVSSASPRRWSEKGVVLAEAVLATAAFAVVAGAMLSGYVLSSRRLAWTSNNTIAQASAVCSLEQAFSGNWTWPASNSVDELTNMTMTVTTNLAGLNGLATNTVTFTNLTSFPKTRLYTSSCVWTFRGKSFTNTVAVIRAPNY